jgi:hypothetical protein
MAILALCAFPFSPGVAQESAPSGTRRFAVEAAGGVLGSAVGATVGLAAFRVDKCPVDDDVKCVLGRLSLTGATSVVGATLGVVLLGRAQDTEPSIGGAFIGSVAGAAAGAGVLSVTSGSRAGTSGHITRVVLYSLAQGVVAAVGSRFGARIAGR